MTVEYKLSSIAFFKMRIVLLSFILTTTAFWSPVSAQSAIGSWQAHLAYGDVTSAIPAFNQIFAIGSGGLFSYDPEDNSILTYDKTNVLNDQTISFIEYNKLEKCLAVVYSNFNIDLMYEKEKVFNIPSYMDKNMPDPTINKVNSFGNHFYLCTDFGIVAIDAQKAQVANTYVIDRKVYACAVKGNFIYAVTNKGLVVGSFNDNLLDASNWKTINTTEYRNILLFDNHLFLVHSNDGIFLYDEETQTTTLSESGRNYTIGYNNDNILIFTNGYGIKFYTSYDARYIWTWPSGQSFPYFSSICALNNTYYVAHRENGLHSYSLDLSDPSSFSFTPKEELGSPNGPIRNLADYMIVDHNRLLVCGGGSWTYRKDNPGTIMQYKNNNWSSFEEGLKEYTGQDYKDISTIAVNPKDSSNCFASSVGEGIYEFKGGKFIELYTYKNSSLETISKNNPDTQMRINGLNFDRSGNLWAMNMFTDNIIKVRKASGEWISLFYSEIKNAEAPNRTLIDSRGWVWVACMLNTNGVFCLDTNGTLENTADDRTRFRSSYTNQDGTTVSGESEALRTFAIVEDKEGAIWIGTAQGPLLVNNPTKWFDTDFRITQVKIPRNDGTNLADYLLAGERINAIAIDGANRKWFGTQNNGIYLVSADGTKEIHHFTTSNSPLLSNTILSIAVLPQTGEVFIGTDKGINSYQSDATEAGESFASEVYAFPNPVRSDYTGVIAVKGLAYDSDVKIVDAGGHIVTEGRSTGGLFSWDGRNQNGSRVSSGVYFVLAATSDGSEGVVTKIVMIR